MTLYSFLIGDLVQLNTDCHECTLYLDNTRRVHDRGGVHASSPLLVHHHFFQHSDRLQTRYRIHVQSNPLEHPEMSATAYKVVASEQCDNEHRHHVSFLKKSIVVLQIARHMGISPAFKKKSKGSVKGYLRFLFSPK